MERKQVWALSKEGLITLEQVMQDGTKIKAQASRRSHPYAYRYMVVTHMDMPLEQEWKKGSAELLILSLLEDQPRHGYDIGKLIESRSGGKLRFHIASLYPLLYRLENRGWIQGRWVEKPNQRRRRYSYVLTGFGTDWVGEAEIGAWELRASCRTFILLPERIWSGHWPFPVSGARLAGFSRG